MPERLRCWTTWSEDDTGTLVPSVEPAENTVPKSPKVKASTVVPVVKQDVVSSSNKKTQ